MQRKRLLLGIIIAICSVLILCSVSPAFAQVGSISGQITDTIGNPISELWVQTWTDSCNGEVLMGIGATTDSNGEFTITGVPAGLLYVQTSTTTPTANYVATWWDGNDGSIECDQAVAVNVVAGQETGGINMVVEEGGLISGTILDTQGDPVPGLWVQTWTDSCYGEVLMGVGATTDSNGEFTITGVPAGLLYVQTSNNTPTTGYVSKWWDGNDGSIECEQAMAIDVIAGQETGGINMVVEEGAEISGTVWRNDGNPLTGVEVQIEVIQGDPCEERRTIMRANTDSSDGTYRILGVPAGTYFLQSENMNQSNYLEEWWTGSSPDPSSLDCSLAQPLVVNPADVLAGRDFQLDLGGTISGYVYQSDGITPISNLHVFATDYATNQLLGGTNTNPDGSYTITTLPEGDYRVRACASCDSLPYIDEFYDDTSDYGAAIPVTVTEANNTPNITFALEQGGTISGTVLDANGDPIDNLHVFASEYVTNQWTARTNTDANGNYSLRVSAGDYRVRACASCDNLPYIDKFYDDTSDYDEAIPVSVTEPDDTSGIDFILESGATISGTIYEEDGTTPLSNVCVDAYTNQCGDPTPDGTGITDANGNYSILLPPGDYYIHTHAACQVQQDFIDEWWNGFGGDGTTNCNDATQVAVTAGQPTSGVNLSLRPAVTQHSGTISADETWDAGTTHYVIGETWVANGVTLTIDPGAVIKFAPSTSLYVNGTLDVNGANGNEAVFTSQDDDTYGEIIPGSDGDPQPGEWYWVFLNGIGEFDYARIRYGGKSFSPTSPGANVYYGSSGSGYFVNSISEYSAQTGVVVSEGSPTIEHSTFSDNAEHGLYVSYGSPEVKENSFLNNGQYGIAFFLDNDVENRGSLSLVSGNTGSGNGTNAIGVIGQWMILTDQTWPFNAENFPYIIGRVEVANGATLTIPANVIVKIPSSGYMGVYTASKLDVNGEPGNKVVFTSLYDDSYGGDTNGDGGATTPAPGDWPGIYLGGGDGEFDYARVRYGGTGVDYDSSASGGYFRNSVSEYNAQDGVRIQGGAPTIESNVLSENGGRGLTILGSNMHTVRDNTILNNTQGGLAISNCGMLTVKDNTFLNNTQYAIDVSLGDTSGLTYFTGNSGNGNGINGIGISGRVRVDQSWPYNAENFPYIINSNISVDNGATLTIPAGVIIKAQSAKGLSISGGLIVDGEPENEVVFTSIADDTYAGDTNGDGNATSPAPGAWDGMSLYGIGEFDYARIRYGSTNISYGDSASGYFTNSVSEYGSTYGLRTQNARVNVTNSRFENNGSYAIYERLFDTLATATCSGNTGSGNGINGIGIDGSLTVDDTWFYNELPVVLSGAYGNDNFSISPEATLTISEGVVVKIIGNIGIWVNGKLDVNGSPGNEVIFTSFTDDSYGGDTNGDGSATTPAPGDWYAIQFHDVNARGIGEFDYARIRYSGSYGTSIAYWVSHGEGHFTNSVVEYSLYDGLNIYSSASPTIAGSIFAHNEANGIYISTSGSPTITNSVIVGNATGIYYSGATSPLVTNSIIRGNTTAEISNANAQDPLVVVYSNIQGGYDGEGNIDVDSLFVDPANDDFHLQNGSPCIDVGNNEGIFDWLAVDIDGESRIIHGRVDIGVDEQDMSPGPKILAVTPTGVSQELDHVNINIIHALNRASFTPEDISLRGPAGEIAVTDVIFASNYGGLEVYQAHFPPQDMSGTYTLAIGPNIAGTDGMLLNQDYDEVGGESEDDVYHTTFHIDGIGPRITRHTPAGDVAGTIYHIDVWYSEPVENFVLSDVNITGPSGSISPTSITEIGNNLFRINFNGQTTVGEYEVLIGPNIKDPAGNSMDQDGDGIEGEIEDDVYIASFHLTDVDLTLSNVSIGTPEIWAGEPVNVSWQGANQNGMPLLGAWSDAVYFSEDDQWDIHDELLATVPHTGGLAQDEIYSAAADVVIPGTVPGDYYLIVRADLYNQEKEGGEEGNNIVPIGPIPLHIRPLSANNIPASDILTGSDQFNYYVISVEESGYLEVTLDDANNQGVNELYISYDLLPTRNNYEYRYTTNLSADQTIRIPDTPPGNYYVLVYGENIPDSPANFTITASLTLDFSILDVSPKRAGNTGEITLNIQGMNLPEEVVPKLISPAGIELQAARVDKVWTDLVLATFSLEGQTEGAYDVRLEDPAGPVALLEDGFVVESGDSPQLEVRLIPPDVAGPRRTVPVYIEYTNTGNTDLPAPLFILETDSEETLLYLDPEDPPQKDSIRVMGLSSSAPAGILTPGTTEKLPIYVTLPDMQGTLTINVSFQLRYIVGLPGDGSEMPFDLRWITALDPPAGVDPGEWQSMLDNIRTKVGDTWADYIKSLGGMASKLSMFGRWVYDPNELLGYVLSNTGTSNGSLHQSNSSLDENPPGTLYVRRSDGTSKYWKVADEHNTFPGKPTAIVIHGNANTYQEQWVADMADALCAKLDPDAKCSDANANVLAVDWGRWAQRELFLPNIGIEVGIEPWVTSLYIEEVANRVTKRLIDDLHFYNDENENIHLIGHSHGAHVAGMIGEYLWYKTGKMPKRITALDPSEEAGHLISSPKWGSTSAQFVDSYKSSILFGAERLYGTDNFILLSLGDTLDMNPFLVFHRHDYSHEWFRLTIQGDSGEDNLGYDWDMFSYRNLTNSQEVVHGWNGLINGGTNKIECLSIKKDAPENIQEFWQYPGDWYDGQEGWQEFRDALGSTMEREISSLPDPPQEWQVGEPQTVSFFISNKADNDSIPLEKRQQMMRQKVGNAEEMIWVSNVGEMVWLSEDAVWSEDDVMVTKWQEPIWLDTNDSDQVTFEVTIPPNAFERELGKDTDGNPLPDGEKLYLIFTTGADRSSPGYVVDGELLSPTELPNGNDWTGYNWRSQEITVYPGERPVAKAGKDKTIVDSDEDESETVTLDGSGSQDDKNSINAYRWYVGGFLIGEGAIISHKFSLGSHEVTLVVNDSDNLADSDTVTIRVKKPLKKPGGIGGGGGSGGSGGLEGLEGSIRLVVSFDPNDKIGANGFGNAKFVRENPLLPYKILFENKQEATAPAVLVTVTDVLDEDLDLSTFELTGITFADQIISVPPGLNHYETSLYLTIDNEFVSNTTIRCDITASLDIDTRTLTLKLIGLDLQTGWIPEDVMLGILYPNDESGRGEGSISYLVKAKKNLASGTEITNKASIVFDWNDPIETPLILHTIDAGTPTSEVQSLPATTATSEFLVTWSGEDDAGGSGIKSYDIYVSNNGGGYALWLDNTIEIQAIFTGEQGHTYRFYSVATDYVGHVEDPPQEPDAETTITTQHTLTVEKIGTGTGTVSGNGIECGSVCTKLYDAQTVITLTAEAASGSVFDGWSVTECGLQSECTITIDTDITVTARFNISTGPGPGPGPVIPEPTTLLLFSIGLLGILALMRRKRRQKK